MRIPFEAFYLFIFMTTNKMECICAISTPIPISSQHKLSRFRSILYFNTDNDLNRSKSMI